MPSPLLPELFIILGIDIFLAISLLTCLLDRHFPQAIPYIYQVAALVGFGHLLISREFLHLFGESMRFWYCIIYLFVASANVIAVNIYLAVVKKVWNIAKVFFVSVSFPVTFACAFFVSGYASGIMPLLLSVPRVSLDFLLCVLTGCFVVLGIGVFVSLNHGRRRRNMKGEVK